MPTKTKKIKEMLIYKCDDCKKTFKQSEIKKVKPSTNFHLLLQPIYFMDFEGKAKCGMMDKLEDGDKLLACPHCEKVHLFGFDTEVMKG